MILPLNTTQNHCVGKQVRHILLDPWMEMPSPSSGQRGDNNLIDSWYLQKYESWYGVVHRWLPVVAGGGTSSHAQALSYLVNDLGVDRMVKGVGTCEL